MALGTAWWKLGAAVGLVTSLYAFQRPFRVYRSMEPYDDIPLPPDYREPSEWIEARLDVSAASRGSLHAHVPLGRAARLARGRDQLDAGLSARRPALRAWPCAG